MGHALNDLPHQETPMFKELAPYLRQRAVLLTVTHIEDDQIRVNVIPQKLKDGENAALTTPLTVTGTADELDNDLPATLVNFVSAHLQLRNTLDRAKAEMDAAAKTVQAEARSKAKTTAPKPETTLLKRSNTDGFFGRFEIRLVTLIGPSTLPCRPLPRQELSSPKWRSVRGGSRFGNK